MIQSNCISFDEQINHQASCYDLNPTLIANYLNRVKSNLPKDVYYKSIEEIGMDMKIVGGPSEMRKPLNVGLLFFNNRPDDFFRYARIEIVDKPDPTGQGMTENIFYGPLDEQLSYALRFIQAYIIKEKVFKQDDRPEAIRVFNYPYAAVEEALTNAVYHKSYQIPEPITVYITPTEMSILSISGPDRSISKEDIEKRKMVSKFYHN